MHHAGLRLVDEAEKSGAWDFMNDVDALILPHDLKAALHAQPPALDNYDAFPNSAKRDILKWIKIAKHEATRQKRISETVPKVMQNERAPGTEN